PNTPCADYKGQKARDVKLSLRLANRKCNHFPFAGTGPLRMKDVTIYDCRRLFTTHAHVELFIAS
ncbi:hypothetical protein AVEN_275281-2-1, partial [Araneus ventricosus]